MEIEKTMTEEEEREWVRKAQSGELREEWEWEHGGWVSEGAKAARVVEVARLLYPDGTRPHGAVTAVAKRAGCTRAWAWEVMKSAGFVRRGSRE